MKTSNRLILSTSPLSQPARKPHKTASFGHRQRPLYGRKRRHPTGKERDSETGLYYYGARYLDSKTGRWLSGDPAMADYVPSAPLNDEARKRNGNLPGQGGVFNYVNLHVYHYAGNNPVKYVDPDGEVIWIPMIIAAAVVVSVLLRSDTVQSSNPVNRSKVLSQMNAISNLYYDGHPQGIMASAKDSNFKTDSIMLRRDPLSAVGISMPMGSPQPDDYSNDGYGADAIIKGTSVDAKMGSLGLANSMMENMTDGHGHMFGDIRLDYTKDRGSLTSWSIIETTRNPISGKLENSFYTKEQALLFLHTNREKFSETQYREMCNKLGLD